jgi:hypothetical protein
VWEAARALRPPTLSDVFVQGMTGGVARAAKASLTFTELEAMLLPGLLASGVRAELLPLPEEDAALRRLLRERLRRGVPVPVTAFSHAIALPLPGSMAASERIAEDSDAPTVEAAPPIVTRQGLVVALETEGDRQITLRDDRGREKRMASKAFRAAFSHALRLRKAAAQGSRRFHVQAALLRWLAFSEACPDCLPTAAKEDAPVRAAAAAFLREIAGRQRTPVAIRLRRAADRFASARASEDMEGARHALREAVFLDLRLPAVVQRALLSSPATPLTDVERRELIYLARAGTRDLKVLSARRLAPERPLPDVCGTLEQLAYDADAWVRAAAKPLPRPDHSRA